METIIIIWILSSLVAVVILTSLSYWTYIRFFHIKETRVSTVSEKPFIIEIPSFTVDQIQEPREITEDDIKTPIAISSTIDGLSDNESLADILKRQSSIISSSQTKNITSGLDSDDERGRNPQRSRSIKYRNSVSRVSSRPNVGRAHSGSKYSCRSSRQKSPCLSIPKEYSQISTKRNISKFNSNPSIAYSEYDEDEPVEYFNLGVFESGGNLKKSASNYSLPRYKKQKESLGRSLSLKLMAHSSDDSTHSFSSNRKSERKSKRRDKRKRVKSERIYGSKETNPLTPPATPFNEFSSNNIFDYKVFPMEDNARCPSPVSSSSQIRKTAIEFLKTSAKARHNLAVNVADFSDSE